MRRIPRCPACRQPALKEGWTETDLVSLLAVPGTRVVCVACGASFTVDRATEWIRVP